MIKYGHLRFYTNRLHKITTNVEKIGGRKCFVLKLLKKFDSDWLEVLIDDEKYLVKPYCVI
jgi:hypothetical protein